MNVHFVLRPYLIPATFDQGSPPEHAVYTIFWLVALDRVILLHACSFVFRRLDCSICRPYLHTAQSTELVSMGALKRLSSLYICLFS